MARFRGTVEGSRGGASRLGGAESGLTVTANGWNGGVTVEAHTRTETGEDRFTVNATSGSSQARRSSFLLTLDECGRVLKVGDEVREVVLRDLQAQRASDALAAGIEVEVRS